MLIIKDRKIVNQTNIIKDHGILMGMGMIWKPIIWNEFFIFQSIFAILLCSRWNVSNICSTTIFPRSIGQWGSIETTCEFQRRIRLFTVW